jgi:hypothetical protein
MGIVTRHGLCTPNALEIILKAMGRCVPLPSFGCANAENIARHAKNPLTISPACSKRCGIAEKNPSTEAAIPHHVGTIRLLENLKSP